MRLTPARFPKSISSLANYPVLLMSAFNSTLTSSARTPWLLKLPFLSNDHQLNYAVVPVERLSPLAMVTGLALAAMSKR